MYPTKYTKLLGLVSVPVLTASILMAVDDYQDEKNYVKKAEYQKLVDENKDISKRLEELEESISNTYTKEEIYNNNVELNEKIDDIKENIKSQIESEVKKQVSKQNTVNNNVATNNSSSNKTNNTVQQNGNVLKTITVEASAYTATCKGCSGITKTELDVRNTVLYKGARIIATDPSVIPLYSKVKVYPSHTQEPFIAYAMDIGGAIKGNKIDFLVDSVSFANKFGRQKNVKLEVLEWGKQ